LLKNVIFLHGESSIIHCNEVQILADCSDRKSSNLSEVV